MWVKQGELVFKADGLFYHSTLGSGVLKEEGKARIGQQASSAATPFTSESSSPPAFVASLSSHKNHK
jgi:hypothetical protein